MARRDVLFGRANGRDVPSPWTWGGGDWLSPIHQFDRTRPDQTRRPDDRPAARAVRFSDVRPPVTGRAIPVSSLREDERGFVRLTAPVVGVVRIAHRSPNRATQNVSRRYRIAPKVGGFPKTASCRPNWGAWPGSIPGGRSRGIGTLPEQSHGCHARPSHDGRDCRVRPAHSVTLGVEPLAGRSGVGGATARPATCPP